MAYISKAVYNNNTDKDSFTPKGYKRLTVDEVKGLGLNPDDFYKDAKGESGFYSWLWQKESDGMLVLGYRGTDMSETKIGYGVKLSSRGVSVGVKIDLGQDMKTNIEQGAPLITSDEYRQAIKLCLAVKDVATQKGLEMKVTGHSLGGGLASAAALAADVEGVTFNVAGLRAGTLEKQGYKLDNAKAKEQITAYRMQSELLTYIQESYPATKDLMVDAIGKKVWTPIPAGTPYSSQQSFSIGSTIKNFGERTNLHAMDELLKRTEDRSK